MTITFTKLHGLGNDFLVVDRRTDGSPVPPEVATRLCDRRRGVGGDGVLSVLASARAPLAMHVTNADGSVAEMCGNGLRCVVRWAVDRGLLPPEGGAVETGRGVLDCRVTPEGWVRVAMGAPRLQPAEVPVAAEGESVIDRPWTLGGEHFRLTAVSMGNPHAVVFDTTAAPLRDRARQLGPQLEYDARFPQRVNAGFARERPDGALDLVVWERGAGLTEACGTGACAAVVAAVLTGRRPEGAPVEVHLPGGALRVEVAAGLREVYMTGPAERVFEGVVAVDAA